MHEHDHEKRVDDIMEQRNEAEAREVLLEEMEKIKKFSYVRLKNFMSAMSMEAYDTVAKSGAGYEINVESSWQDNPEGNLLVHVMVFEKEWLAFFPVAGGFVMAPDGSVLEDWIDE